MYRRVVVPLDGSKLAECVLPHVETIAQGCGIEEIVLLQVVEPANVRLAQTHVPYTDFWREVEVVEWEKTKAYLAEVKERVKVGNARVKAEILKGRAADIIADYLEENDVDLVTISTHGRSGVSRWIYGSVADRVLRSSCIPILMVRAPGCVPGI